MSRGGKVTLLGRCQKVAKVVKRRQGGKRSKVALLGQVAKALGQKWSPASNGEAGGLLDWGTWFQLATQVPQTLNCQREAQKWNIWKVWKLAWPVWGQGGFQLTPGCDRFPDPCWGHHTHKHTSKGNKLWNTNEQIHRHKKIKFYLINSRGRWV